MIRLGQAMDGRLVLGSSESFPADIKHVEYYKEQKLFSLVFDTIDEQSELMPCELNAKTAAIVQASPNIMVIAMAEAGSKPYGYTVPLIQIGV
jgi:hypothetical protein